MNDAHVVAAYTRLTTLFAQHGDSAPLAEAAACLAAGEDAEVTVDQVLASVEGLLRGLYVPPGEALVRSVARIRHHLFVDGGLLGDDVTYDHPDNSMLHRVIDRKLGMPITLSVLVVLAGDKVGVPMHGVGFPGHFLAAPTQADPRFWLDAFHGGDVLTRDQLYVRLADMGVPRTEWDRWLAPTPTRQIIMRMAHNLRASYGRRGQHADVGRLDDLLVLIDEA